MAFLGHSQYSTPRKYFSSLLSVIFFFYFFKKPGFPFIFSVGLNSEHFYGSCHPSLERTVHPDIVVIGKRDILMLFTGDFVPKYMHQAKP